MLNFFIILNFLKFRFNLFIPENASFSTNSAEVEHLKWKLDISESRRRRLANTNLKSSPYHSDPVRYILFRNNFLFS